MARGCVICPILLVGRDKEKRVHIINNIIVFEPRHPLYREGVWLDKYEFQSVHNYS